MFNLCAIQVLGALECRFSSEAIQIFQSADFLSR